MSDKSNMNDYSLSKTQLAELEQKHRKLRDKRQADRVKAVIALSKGWSAASISEILLFDEKTSRNYFNRYQQGGLAALLEDEHAGATAKLTERQIRPSKRIWKKISCRMPKPSLLISKSSMMCATRSAV